MKFTIAKLNISTKNHGSKRLETTRGISTFTALLQAHSGSPVQGIKALLGQKKASSPSNLSAQEVIVIKTEKILIKMAAKNYKLERSKTFWTLWMKKI